MASTQQVYDTLLSVRVWMDDERHWRKGSYGRFAAGSTCLAGAVRETADRHSGFREALSVLNDVLAIDAQYMGAGAIPDFNDAPGTTHRDVLNLLDTALDVLEDELDGAA